MIQPSSSRNAPRPWRRWLALLLLLSAAGAAWFFLSQRRGGMPPPMDEATPVQAGTASVARVPVHLDALGTVSANYTVTVTSRIDGTLQAVHFTEGQRVKQGQLLAEIDTRTYQATLAQYRGELAENQAQLANARLTLVRYRRLYARDSLARQDLDTQVALVGQYAGAVKASEAQIRSAQVSVGYGRIVAPIDGYVGLRQVDPGNMVHASDTGGIVTITQTQPIAAKFSVPQANLQEVLQPLRRGESLAVEALSQQGDEVLAEGTVKFISNEIDTATGSVQLKALFDNPDERLYPNQFVNVRLRIGTLENAVLVPAAAVQLSDAGKFVYLIGQDDTVKRQSVTVGPGAEDGRVAILAGVSAGDRVVTQGIDQLGNGAKVSVVDATQVDISVIEGGKRPGGMPPGP
ncbi:MdtA/MuxA family multidrug efflux RND transporter periplasmic adaptor subunit [Azotobacter beijerinckii]|uniref:Membrane fusion protein, multidrug efflux system n=1 Tax=Azotobacter beijerinckii TaxID=170623 RepID=A0A1I4C820_9GAMM|nr:MdtA/MuxA family multidrug efflux RND transporter periplasmic adaptor subunit [Azotobacter beijerinckii]SFB16062.1 membrane fusion protein, multidrug efflux system [Azotobacter beijerinckii]SFK76800.1 membrane fusion protein, multidrug efflux system [Azotobacter beijerinckii]